MVPMLTALSIDRMLLADRRFRSLLLGLMFIYLSGWIQISMLPVLVALKFGTGTELVISLALRLLPRIVFAPVAGTFIQRYGAKMTVVTSTLALSIVTLMLPCSTSIELFQLAVVMIGILDTAIMPSLLLLRSEVIPEGRNMTANSFYQSVDRASKIIGPPLAGFMLYLVGAPFVFLLLAITYVMVGISFWTCLTVDVELRQNENKETILASIGRGLKSCNKIIKRDVVLIALVIPAMGYMITLGATQPFLFWLNRDVFGGAPGLWTMLLAAQGWGALMGAIVVGVYGPRLEARYSLLSIYLVASLVEGISCLALAVAPGHVTAILILVVGGIPEMLAYVTYFSIIQRRLNSEEQGFFYAMSLPLFDIFLAAGIFAGVFYSSGALTLIQFWAFATSFAILPVLPWFILLIRQSDGDENNAKHEERI